MDLCKKIAKSLTSAANRRARGAKMFAKRKQKSTKWIHDGERYHGSSSAGDVADLRDLDSELIESEGGLKPLFQFRIPNLANRVNYNEDHKMSLSKDEFERLRLSSNKVDHTSVSPTQCHSLVADLQSTRNRGAKLFQKRAARSEKWVIDEHNAQKPPPQPRLNEIVSHSPGKHALSPWEAAMENPLGYVDKASFRPLGRSAKTSTYVCAPVSATAAAIPARGPTCFCPLPTNSNLLTSDERLSQNRRKTETRYRPEL